ncbi:glycosyltransferase family 9 protein [Shewanella bicestrii]|uniref:glycosyltransferase family 9 protein n=1 Tax=Shewanella TaxID=22 RepID=UPI00055BCCA0|nr:MULTISPECIES: glycosyltransferase family 9 protein [Shewanella]QXN24979.1 glycosyltransferase family 9 protein [Shewanella putrefaciens]MBW0296187.1 ADP-heptose--LPS heptosyltransferase I [Shewanella xiamenensis]MDH1472360.1 glycosyltransferase family 9 protein [Shewanella sp. GD03713]MDV5246883.1 glycosyltransferase family 9 protein [Shewanella xiamenensis]PWH03465.1 glycosyltransferase family 9 protein [Shewanella xiamenensis]
MSLNPNTMNSLCLLRLSAIGDVCHAVAMVQAIQRQYPQLKITWVIGKLEYQLLKHLPGIEFVIFDKSQGWRSYLNLHKALKGRRFDVLLHMQVALRATLASLAISAKVRVGFDRARAKEGQWLVTNHRVEPLAEPHVLDGFMGFAKAIGVSDITPSWNIPVPQADTEFAQRQIADGEKVLVICAAASKAERNWLPERYAAVAQHAVNKGYRVILCGGPTALEKTLADDIANACSAKLDNLVGKTSLTQLLALLKRASLVLAPDTGPAHMAVTQGTPVIGLYAHSNPGRTGPYLSQQYVVSAYQEAIASQQSGEVKWGTRAKGEHLMALISVEAVIEKFDQVIQQTHS